MDNLGHEDEKAHEFQVIKTNGESVVHVIHHHPPTDNDKAEYTGKCLI